MRTASLAGAGGMRAYSHASPVREATSGTMAVLIVFISLVVFKLHLFLPPLPRPALLLAPVALALVWNHASPSERTQTLGNKLFRMTLLYLGYATLTIPTSVLRGASLELVIGLLPQTLLVLIIALLPPTVSSVDRLLKAFMLCGTTLGFGSLVFNMREFGRLSAPRMFDANDLGAVMAVSAPIALGLVLRGTLFSRVIGALCFAISAWTLMQTGSRGSFIGFMVAVLTVVLFAGGSRRVIGSVLLVIASAIFMANAPATFRDRISTIGEEDYNTTAYSGRQQVWMRGMEYLAANPILGVGVGAFPVAEGLRLQEQGLRGVWLTAHNTFVQAFAELGFPGGTIFVVLVGMSAAAAARRTSLNRKQKVPLQEMRPEILGAVLGLAVAGFFLSLAYFALWDGLWGLCCLLLRIEASRAGVMPVTVGPPQGLAPAVRGRHGAVALRQAPSRQMR